MRDHPRRGILDRMPQAAQPSPGGPVSAASGRPTRGHRSERELPMSVPSTTVPISQPPTWREVIERFAPLVLAPAYFGPPAVFLIGPWLLLVLMLIPPAALLITFAM